MYISDIHENTELSDVAKLFYGDCFPNISLKQDGTVYKVVIDGNEYENNYDSSLYNAIPQSKLTGRLSKIALYDALSAYTGRKMPWGALTGVRPTKLFYECLNGGKTPKQTVEIMQNVYRVEEKRAKILQSIVNAQNGQVKFSANSINLYVHIPYCTTRCSYCSFVSLPIDKNKVQSEKYIELLCDEIKQSVDFLRSCGKNILTVYIGGGTPTALADDLFVKLLDSIGDIDCEYTCEAGRPDTVTFEKAAIMKAHNVTRVCVNPQTLCESTLKKIGRKHSVSDFYKSYDVVKQFGFDINCDLIAGLADETIDDFIGSFDGIKALLPQNITVHSLSKKNGSAIRYTLEENTETANMVDYALSHLDDYIPYYLYRQKRQTCNLENVGFTLPDSQCINNITTMEETVGVMACGAGAISKFVGNGTIGRFANLRDVSLYISNYEEKTRAKLEFFAEQFGL